MSKFIPSSSIQINLIIFVLLLFTLLPFYGNCQTSMNPERSILLEIKHHFSNPSNLSHWTSSSDHCTWPEITCADGSVTGIRLAFLMLNQTIPPSICDLKNLTILDLNHNFIPGPFPVALYNCSNLEFLDLSFNYFNGSIPTDIDRLSPLLAAFNLSSNSFTDGIPPDIGGLKELKELQFANTFLSGSFPREIGDLLNLEILVLDNNAFAPQEIPSSFTQLKKLRILWITSSNLVGEIPENIGNMTALEFLALSENSLSGNIPNSLFLLKNLTTVYISVNKLSGSIPQSVEALNLYWIDFSNNTLTGKIPQDFGKLKKLEGLVLFMNQLSGEIPGSIGSLPALWDVRLFTNNLAGEIPADFGKYSKLQRFDVSTNNLVGSLPEGLCDNKVLSSIIAFNNNLTGELPKSLGDCQTLESVRVEKNQLSGTIPDGLWAARSLSRLLISHNLFTGELPQKVALNLSLVDIRNNWFSGEIPDGVSSWNNVVNFKASNNLFTGEIPQELTALQQLSVLWLDGNQLSRNLPSEIISWKSLTSLKCSRNQLSGEIPSALGLLQNLNELDLSGNQFSGEVPPEMGRLTLTSLNLSSNHLSGRIPGTLENAAFDKSFLNNPDLCATTSSVGLSSCNNSIRLIAILGSIAAALVLVAVLYILFVLRKNWKMKEGLVPNWKLTPFHRLSFTESNILPNLLQHNVIGSGRSGEVYLVPLHQTGEKVFVKRIWNCKKLDQRLEKEFKAEVEILGTIRHSNIVKLLCEISSEDSMLLVYEYMENRSLDLWLRPKFASRPHFQILEWPTRLHIATGAAQGLCYMHHDCSPPIIHRDVKSSNVLLDSEFNPKIGDFGLARMLIRPGETNTVSTLADSFGYIAPECAHTSKVNEKMDVYNFGVILLELVTGRETNDSTAEVCLADWARKYVQEGKPIADALDAVIKKPQHLGEMQSMFKLGILCTDISPSRRPTMKYVLESLLSLLLAHWKLTSFHSLSFTESDILNNLTDENVIGSGGAGKVYLVPLHRTGEKVAVKRIWISERSGKSLEKEKQFQAEVQILGKICDSNIVKLLCEISSEDSKLLVYEYMENRSLDLWLHPKRRPDIASPPHWKVLEWPTRLHIATGAAQGLCYMHHGCSPPIIHRDVKSSNVLLDSEFNPKIGDFGLARMLIMPGKAKTVTTVAGTRGYIAPEYASRYKVNTMTDVYSFGVILLELVTGKVALNLGEDFVLAEWARQYVQEGKPIADALDAVIKKPQYLDEMQSVFRLGISCIRTSPSKRPTMEGILEILQKFQPQSPYADNINGSERDASPLLKHTFRHSFNIHSGSGKT